ncbi:MAG: T9SS type A sorting domain-containing protein [Muribaculaceae bacterium]|nr:T9SS type A sorting domain-containing protein [Muribaculaceae bacterium]MDE6510369.1 T9SS type A sorting domain-containing protein [Muribaculaceae bacterium]
MKKIITACALSTAFVMPLTASSPLTSGLTRFPSDAASIAQIDLSPAKVMSRAGSSDLTFFESFEGRPEGFGTYYDEWLPEGWQDLSKSGQTVPLLGEARHNLTWRVLSNEDRSSAPNCNSVAFEGECFAYIMPDQAYGDHLELDYQDEWLITPAVVPTGEDWLFFRVHFDPSWVVYNREANDFSGENNSLQVYATTDDGATWTKLWDLIDDEIRKNWTDEQLRADLIDWTRLDYTPVYVNISDYLDKSVKFAFRFYGNYGHGVGLDNVSVGVPQPEALYAMPAGCFRQGISSFGELPAVPTLIMPADRETVWANRSEASQRYVWTYSDKSGATVTSDVVDLVTPAYETGSLVQTPSLVGIFESRQSEPFCLNHTMIQAGGTLKGEDTSGNECEFGAGVYDIMDPLANVFKSTDNISFNPSLDLIWERNLGMMDGAIDVGGFCNLYPASPVPYGFDFIDMAVIVPEPLREDSQTMIQVYTLADGSPDEMIGIAFVGASDYTVSENVTNIRFKFDVPVFVPANTDIITLMVHSDRDYDTIVFPYLRTTSSAVGNSLLYYFAWDAVNEYWYDTFYNMNNMPFATEGHFAGLLQSIGVTYATAELLDADASIEAPMEGTTKEFRLALKGTDADRVKITEDGLTVPDWISYKVTEGSDGVHTLAITVKPIEYCEDRETRLHVVIPGDHTAITVKQTGNPDKPSGLTDVETTPAVSVTVESGNIVIDGAKGSAAVINTAGQTVASAALAGRTTIEASHLPKGIYVVCVNGNQSFKIVK